MERYQTIHEEIAAGFREEADRELEEFIRRCYIDPLPSTPTELVTKDPSPVKVSFSGNKYLLHKVIDGLVFGCEKDPKKIIICAKEVIV